MIPLKISWFKVIDDNNYNLIMVNDDDTNDL